MKQIVLIIYTLILLVSCKTIPTIERNYKYAPEKECDCVVTQPKLTVWTNRKEKDKENAFCNRKNYSLTNDSINLISEEIDHFEELFYKDQISADSLEKIYQKMEEKKNRLKNTWTDCKVKTKVISYHLYSDGERIAKITEIKRKIVYYNRYRFIFKRLRNEKLEERIQSSRLID